HRTCHTRICHPASLLPYAIVKDHSWLSLSYFICSWLSTVFLAIFILLCLFCDVNTFSWLFLFLFFFSLLFILFFLFFFFFFFFCFAMSASFLFLSLLYYACSLLSTLFLRFLLVFCLVRCCRSVYIIFPFSHVVKHFFKKFFDPIFPT